MALQAPQAPEVPQIPTPSTSGWSRVAQRTPGKWSFWRYNWIAHHKVIRALDRVRPHVRGRLLDVGCGTMPARDWLRGAYAEYLGIDLPGSIYTATAPISAYARGEALPLRDASVDTVLGLSLLTYLEEPGRFIAEAARVLRPDGRLVLEFTQMAPLHDPPHDYFRFTRFGARWLLEVAGFEPIEFVPIGGLWSRVALSLIAPLNRLNRGPIRAITELPVRAAYVVIQLAGELLDRLFGSSDEVLAHLVVARRRAGPSPTEGRNR